MAKLKAILTITVLYEEDEGLMNNQEMMAEAKSNLDNLVTQAANKGLLSGDSPMLVESWEHKVTLLALDE